MRRALFVFALISGSFLVYCAQDVVDSDPSADAHGSLDSGDIGLGVDTNSQLEDTDFDESGAQDGESPEVSDATTDADAPGGDGSDSALDDSRDDSTSDPDLPADGHSDDDGADGQSDGSDTRLTQDSCEACPRDRDILFDETIGQEDVDPESGGFFTPSIDIAGYTRIVIHINSQCSFSNAFVQYGQAGFVALTSLTPNRSTTIDASQGDLLRVRCFLEADATSDLGITVVGLLY